MLFSTVLGALAILNRLILIRMLRHLILSLHATLLALRCSRLISAKALKKLPRHGLGTLDPPDEDHQSGYAPAILSAYYPHCAPLTRQAPSSRAPFPAHLIISTPTLASF